MQQQLELMDLVRLHTDQYAGQAKGAFTELTHAWADLELDECEQRAALQGVMAAVCACWSDALAAARSRQQGMRDSIQQALSGIMAIKEELGSTGNNAELDALQGNRSGHRTLKAWQADVLAKEHYWQGCRKQRVADHDDLQGRIKLLRQLCGLPPQPPALTKPDISTAGMEFLRLELERLATEKERREELLRGLLDELTAACGDTGEDARQAATEVHPNLVYLWDAEAARVLKDVMKDVYRLGGGYATGVSPSSLVDLSDTTISRMGFKLSVMRDLKASRAAHATSTMAVLHSLWDATEVPDADRAHFVRLMSGPLRLHASSLEKCMAEVRRLEDMRYQQMVDLVLTKGEELSSMCKESHVEEPAGLQAALTAIHGEDRNPGAAAELLAKLLHMLAEVQVLTSKRATIIASINEVEAARSQELWLAEYEGDAQRYQGRDANKKLQRAIRAAKLRDRLPQAIGDLRRLLDEWKESEGESFLFDGRDYAFERLDGLAVEVEEAAAARAAAKAAATSKRRQSLAGEGAPSPGTAPGSSSSRSSAAGGRLIGPTPRKAGAGAPPTPPASRVSSSASRRVGGPATPMALRGVSNRSISERHSICVVRDRDADGPGALARSGEVLVARPTSAAGHASTTASRRTTAASSSTTSSSRRASTDSLAAARRFSSEGVGTSSSSSLTPPPCSGGQDVQPVSGGTKRENTSSKLDTIFRRCSVQHPVAMLSSEPSGLHTDSAKAADQGAADV